MLNVSITHSVLIQSTFCVWRSPYQILFILKSKQFDVVQMPHARLMLGDHTSYPRERDICFSFYTTFWCIKQHVFFIFLGNSRQSRQQPVRTEVLFSFAVQCCLQKPLLKNFTLKKILTCPLGCIALSFRSGRKTTQHKTWNWSDLSNVLMSKKCTIRKRVIVGKQSDNMNMNIGNHICELRMSHVLCRHFWFMCALR